MVGGAVTVVTGGDELLWRGAWWCKDGGDGIVREDREIGRGGWDGCVVMVQRGEE